MLKWPLIASIFLSFAGCSTIYVSPKVDARDGKVRVLPLNAETVLVANRATYNPKQLPAVFFQNAGGGGLGRGAGAAPVPSLDAQQRPTAMVTRIPGAVNPGAYQIGVGDVLLLATKSGGSTVEELSGLLAAQNSRQGYTVQDDGAIAVPDVGRVQLAGLRV